MSRFKTVSPVEDAEVSKSAWVALRVLAFAGLVASLSVRAVEPSIVGVWSGIDDAVNAWRLVGALLSQGFAWGGGVVAVVFAVRLGRQQASGAARALAVGACMMVALSLVISSGALSELVRRVLGERLVTRLPHQSQLILATASALFVAVVGRDVLPRREVRGAGFVAVAVACVVASRTLAIAAHAFAPVDDPRVGFGVARVFATLEWGALAFAGVIALAWVGTARSPRLTLPEWARRAAATAFVVLAIGGASAVTFLAIRGQSVDASGWAVFFARMSDHLLDPFAPPVPLSLRIYVECLRWTVAVGALLLSPRGGAASASVALLLTGCGEATSPAGALALVLGAGCLAAAPPTSPFPLGDDDATVLAPDELAD